MLVESIQKGNPVSKKLLAISVLTMGSFIAIQTNAATALTSPAQKLSYTIGYEMGQNFKAQNVTIDNAALMQGLEDGISGQTGAMTQQERQQTIADFQKQMIATQQSQIQTQSAQNQKDGTKFLATNAKVPGVTTLKDGLQYKVITAGKGDKPGLNDTVTVNYEGQFINGQVFDSSYQRGKPVTFALNQVIKGWQEALTLMPAGSTWEVYIPGNLAYGEKGMGSVIGPNQTLIFKINLISIQKAS